MYADDMLLLSRSEKGLKRSLNILDMYCKKWRLVVNTKKTKIMIFNKKISNNTSYQFRGEQLEIVKYYTYLGITICCNGSFLPAIKELTMLANRGRYTITYLSIVNISRR